MNVHRFRRAPSPLHRIAPAISVAAALASLPAAAAALGGAYPLTRHGDAKTGVQRVVGEPPGACAQCHVQHARDPGRPGIDRARLFAPNDNALCASCHLDAGRAGSYPGAQRYAQSFHATSPSMVWPGGGARPRARSGADAGKCVNCHDPHGVRDASGVVPALLAAREDALCLGCHDGSRTLRDIRGQFAKPHAHPIATARRHRPDEGLDPAHFAAAPGEARHVACSDCHDAHLARESTGRLVAPEAQTELEGASRIRVTNGTAGTQPAFTAIPGSDPSVAREYEVCFKCHSSWTRLPVGQPDLAVLLNPANASYHPVEAAGRNARIDSRAFTADWTAARTVYCSDCHGSDDPDARGPHGSSHRHLLRKPYSASTFPDRPGPGDLCFECHRYDVYASPTSSAAAASRFNPPAAPWGHAYHVGAKGYSCYACHESHGSAQYPALIATGRSPGMTSFFPSLTGGTCGTSCHAGRSYGANYPR